MSNGVILLKKPYISPNIALRGSECENNLSWPGNLFQVLNLSCDSCFKVKWVSTVKCPYFTLIIGAMALEYKDRPSKVLAFKCFA